jgi:hypothetical protein
MSQSNESNRYSVLMETNQEPDVKDGIDYWASQPASLDGVLGLPIVARFLDCFNMSFRRVR